MTRRLALTFFAVVLVVCTALFVYGCYNSNDEPLIWHIPAAPPGLDLDTNGHIIHGQGGIPRPITAESYRTNARAGWEAGRK